MRLSLTLLQSLRGIAFGLLFGIAATAHAQEKALTGIALVVGEAEYEHLPSLANPANDAKAIDRLLSDLGFEVDLVQDADQKKLSRALKRFVEDAEGADVALIYYSGHGIEAGGENFLVPVDADVGAAAAEAQDLCHAHVELIDALVRIQFAGTQQVDRCGAVGERGARQPPE